MGSMDFTLNTLHPCKEAIYQTNSDLETQFAHSFNLRNPSDSFLFPAYSSDQLDSFCGDFVYTLYLSSGVVASSELFEILGTDIISMNPDELLPASCSLDPMPLSSCTFELQITGY